MTIKDVAEAWAVTEHEALCMVVTGLVITKTRWRTSTIIAGLVGVGRARHPLLRFEVALVVLEACGTWESGVQALIEHGCDVAKLAASNTTMGDRVRFARERNALQEVREEAERVYRGLLDFGIPESLHELATRQEPALRR